MNARELPSLREQLIRWGEVCWQRLYEDAIKAGNQLFYPEGPPAQAGALMASREVTRLRMADLYYVSEEMTELAAVAAESLPNYRLRRDDLPSEFGLIVFERPIAWNSSLNVGIIAASWGPFQDCPPEWATDGAVWLTLYGDIRGTELSAEQQLACRRLGIALPPIAIETEKVLDYCSDEFPFGQLDSPYTVAQRVILTTWTLMQQETLTQLDTVRPPRAAVRRLPDQDRDRANVRVITLRRPRSTGSGEHSDREYRHRWIVRGHWRQQWYASRRVHRPVWIAPHVKGPEDAPLLTTDKVYAWTR